nr:BMP family ABC transporter substrate-binding protein [Lachnospiraceae bacterium]
RQDYMDAKKLGDSAVRRAKARGESPYLPVLDSFLDQSEIAGESALGVIELPISMIKGNKSEDRNNAFASNFMPIFQADSEFGVKWSNLYDALQTEGVNTAIKVYEYLNNYYVLEGNKRVSVSKYIGTEYIPADVTRLIPLKSEEKNIQVYYEYMEFYEATKNFEIIMNEKGEYARLCEIFGYAPGEIWEDDDRLNLKSAYIRFKQAYASVEKKYEELSLGESFLIYLSIFPPKTVLDSSKNEIIANIKLARNEIQTDTDIKDIDFVDTASEEKAIGGIMGFFGLGGPKYTEDKPLKVAFIYGAGVDESRWIDSHEAGRIYVEEALGEKVVTKSYTTREKNGDIENVLKEAIDDKNEVIITVAPYMMSQTLRAAVENPSIKFLNYSVGVTSSSVRSYSAKLYEGTFLMGMLAANELLLNAKPGEAHRIGYLADYPTNGSISNINAFAIGASIIDPTCRISLKWSSAEADKNYIGDWKNEGVRIYSDVDYTEGADPLKRPGVYMTDDEGNNIYLGAPYYRWGRYYSQILQSVLNGSFDALSIAGGKVTNYLFGLSSGVVDIRVGDIPHQTKKLLELMKTGLVSGAVNPFSGELRSKDGIVLKNEEDRKSLVTDNLKKMAVDEIVTMNWLNENIDGGIPTVEELDELGRKMVKLLGVNAN